MRELPILFSTPMVQAILDGRKTMTRRVIKVDDAPDNWKASIAGTSIVRTDPYNVKLSRYAAGDRLWVREAWARLNNDYHPDDNGKIFVYKADHITGNDGPDLLKWKPSIHMSKAAARIWLEVTNVRVERLQRITEEDAIAEGISASDIEGIGRRYFVPGTDLVGHRARYAFVGLWDSINAKRGYGWDINPFVWCISFKVIEEG